MGWLTSITKNMHTECFSYIFYCVKNIVYKKIFIITNKRHLFFLIQNIINIVYTKKRSNTIPYKKKKLGTILYYTHIK